ncbi:carbohydrate kinase family protein [Actinoplanes sp. N902-109]|uniref:carbohydrate kinase family protein n=1 Tax=Actinoplanes sp. (strain N902-109) TaxID=649831 RepID=UPI0003293B70|nr:sugar kinase [Actinoplanes sp. N902-109]AGL18042.1 putative carbohydrate kinase [Actinoplanes sp. N902-109]
MDVLVVGDANPDLVLRGDVRPRFGQAEQLLTGADLVLGGSAAITAAGCARLGLDTALLTALGPDIFGTITRQRLAERDVRLLLAPTAPEVPTGLSVILTPDDDDRAILTLPGTIPALRPHDVTDDHLAATRHLHVAALYLQPGLAAGLAEVFTRARAAGVTTSLDTNWDPTGRWESITDILAVTDIFLPNANELRAVTGASDVDTAAAGLVATGTTVVMKNGAAGARAWTSDGDFSAPGRQVAVVDTTGAGDSFNAGFLAGMLSGLPLRDALHWAATAGSLSTRAAGGTAAQPTRADLGG